MAFITEFVREIGSARAACARVRVLFDNRAGLIFSNTSARTLAGFRATLDPQCERIAIVVADSLDKVRAKHGSDGGAEVFLSERAAVTWLTAWDHEQHARVTDGALTAS
jgi:hypothetical protein